MVFLYVKKSKIDKGNIRFDMSLKNINDAYSYYCKICIKKQNNLKINNK